MLTERPVEWRDGRLFLLDQTRLPGNVEWLELTNAAGVREAIRELRVRGAPAIGIAAAFGYALAANACPAADTDALCRAMAAVRASLGSARPTAVNLAWALDRMEQALVGARELSVAAAKERLIHEAKAIQTEDEAACRRMGEHAVSLLHDGMGVLTHCNTGGLATSRYGTALAAFYVAHERGWRLRVFAGETRPVLQGARLTAWELMRAGIDVTLICDNMAATVMAQGKAQAVLVGADRIARNGDTANKIGTLGLAVLARHFGLPFYVVAPTSTFDPRMETGGAIPIEERRPEEVTEAFGTRTAPEGVQVYNPAFDVTPGELITAIVTERGVLRPPYEVSLPGASVPADISAKSRGESA